MSTDPIADAIVLSPRLTLRPMTGEAGEALGPLLAGIEPWSRIGYAPARMTAFLTAHDPALRRHAVHVEGALAGVIAVRSPWLLGPYLQLLALLPPCQGQGFGALLLGWLEREAAPHSRWLWLCHSRFNTRAGAFYARHGFERVADLADLLADGEDEVLMRKRINATAPA